MRFVNCPHSLQGFVRLTIRGRSAISLCSAAEKGGLIDAEGVKNSHLRGAKCVRQIADAGGSSKCAGWMADAGGSSKILSSLRGKFAIFAGRWRKTANIIFFDIRPTPSAHREPPLGEISGNIMDFHFFRFVILFRKKGKFHYIFFNFAYC